MGIIAGQTALAEDFIDESSGASDSGKGVKLNASGELDDSFLNEEVSKRVEMKEYTTLATSTNAPHDGFLVGRFIAQTTSSTSETGEGELFVDGTLRAYHYWRKSTGTDGVYGNNFCVPIKKNSQYTTAFTKETISISYVPLEY